MIVYVLKRLVAMLPTLLGITFVTFLIINLAPGDPVATKFGAGAGSERGMGGAGGGGAQSRERQADAIKAKKKLLGMVTEDRTVSEWPTAGTGGEAQAWERSERLAELAGWPLSLARLSDGRLVAGTSAGEVVVLDGELLAATLHPAGDAGAAQVSALAVLPDGDVVAGDTQGAVARYDVGTGQQAASTSPLGKQIRDVVAVGDLVATAADDGKVRILEPDSLKTRYALDGHLSGVWALAVLPDGGLVSAGYDQHLRVWDADAGTLVADHPGVGAAVNDLALSPDGTRLALALADRTVAVLPVADLDGGTAVLLKGHYKEVSTVAWVDDDRLVTGSADETARLWSVRETRELAQSTDIAGAVKAVLAADGIVFTAARSWREVPVWKRYLRWLGRTATLDFDRSFVDDRLVIDKIAEALPITLGMNLVAITIIYVVSIPLGVMAAVRRGSAFDQLSSVLLFLLYSMPSFWVGTMLIMSFSSVRTLDILPSVGLYSDNQLDMSYLPWLWDRISHLVLPVATMVYGGFASLSRYARTTMLETIQEDYVRTARAKGLPEYIVVFKHAFRNSLITIVTLIGNLLPAMIGGSVIVEYIFTIEGMGRLGFDAILARDYPVIMAITTFSAFLTLLGILVSDLLYSVVDPRVRNE
ncbi:MAG: ABC transporter permease subunit [Alphaproteobacteria bacterium]|nr:ABC transporter permease subunit [Alphaproteobacteria bacterium]